MKKNPSWMPSWDQKSIIRPPVDKLAEVAKILKHFRFCKAFGPLGIPTSKQNWPIYVPRAIKNQAKNWSTSWPNFWSIFGPTWTHLERILASKLELTWDQMPLKSDSKTNQKKRLLFGRPLDRFWVDFGCLLAGCGSTKCFLGVLLALGGSFGRTS